MAHSGLLQQAGSPKKKPSVLARVGQGLIAFGRDVPVAQLEREQRSNEILRNQEQLTAGDVTVQQQDIKANRDEAFRQQQIQSLSQVFVGGGADSQKALDRLMVIAPEIAEQQYDLAGARTAEQRQNMTLRAGQLLAVPPEKRDAAMEEMAVSMEAEGRDATATRSLIGLPPDEQDASLRFFASAGGKAAASKLGQSVVTKDAEGNLSFATPVLTGDEVSTQTTPIGGQIVSRGQGETAAERQQRDVDTAGQKSTAVEISKRDQEFINIGQRQADATAIMRRGLQLLDTIGTGRPEAIALSAKNLFGIAGADETELNANLGKAILSQLRETFGAQFTENEGKRLESIESNFGKSTAGNRRLLQQTLRLMERDARRGIDIANRVDTFAANEIQNALDFSLDPNKVNAVVEKPVSEMTDEEIRQGLAEQE